MTSLFHLLSALLAPKRCPRRVRSRGLPVRGGMQRLMTTAAAAAAAKAGSRPEAINRAPGALGEDAERRGHSADAHEGDDVGVPRRRRA